MLLSFSAHQVAATTIVSSHQVVPPLLSHHTELRHHMRLALNRTVFTSRLPKSRHHFSLSVPSRTTPVLSPHQSRSTIFVAPREFRLTAHFRSPHTFAHRTKRRRHLRLASLKRAVVCVPSCPIVSSLSSRRNQGVSPPSCFTGTLVPNHHHRGRRIARTSDVRV